MKLSVLLCFIATQMILAQQSRTRQRQRNANQAERAANQAERETERAANQDERAANQAERAANQAEKETEKAANQAERAADQAERETERAANQAERETENAAAREPADQNPADPKAAAKAKAAASKAAGKEGVESSALPNGIQEIAQFPTSDFCKQFLGNGGKVEEADGIQRKDGGQTCSSTPLGLVPSVRKMLQTLITEPVSAAVLDVGVDNNVAVRTNSLDSGFFNDPNTQYYLVPSTLNAQTAEIQGHQHITVQKLNSITDAPDPQVFAFFKGVNDVEVDRAEKKLNAVIPAGTIKEDGTYRICTLSGSDGHQGALSPVMERGSQDDCIRVSFTNSAKTSNNLIADDAAQNAAVTINGVASNVVTQADNTGMDAGGQMIEDVAEAMLST